MIDYQAYLASPAWAKRRKVEFAKAGGRCLGCGRRAEAIHHRTYLRLGHEVSADLVALCRDCHRAAHLRHVEEADRGLWNATNAAIQDMRELFGLPPAELPNERATNKAARRLEARRVRQARRLERRGARREVFFASTPPLVTMAEIEAGRSPAGGWTRKQLAAWGVPWPPPKGWQEHLSRTTVLAVLAGDAAENGA